MTQQIINIGSAANDGTGDKLRVAFDKVNDNFTELYASGDKGAKGDAGAQGVQGAAGTGAQGAQGQKGEPGAGGGGGGAQGAQGAQGVQGAIGAQGVQGTNGVDGAQGAQGHQGVQGTTGAGAQGEQGVQGSAGTKGDKGDIGAQGLSGDFSGASFSYTYLTNTANTDPGVGTLKFNDSELIDATELYIDDADKNATDIQNFIRTIDDSSSTIKGHFRISLAANLATFGLYTISSLHENSGYYTVNCSYVSGSDFTFEDSDDVTITFARTGDRGDKGSIGAQGVQGAQGQKGESGGGGANTANVTFQDNIVVGTGVGQNDGLYLAAGTGQVGNLQYLRLRGGDDDAHIHFDTANVEAYDFYIGDDNKYVKLERGYSGNIVIGSSGNYGMVWKFDIDGKIGFPLLYSDRGDTSSGTVYGNTLKFANSSYQAIIAGPEGTDTNQSAERMVIEGGKGYTGTGGEGGDIYIWAGRGGDAGGTGGDIKVRGGYGYSEGGYIRIDGGDTAAGPGGYVEITGGSSATDHGGEIRLIGGYGANGYGNVRITSASSNWRFNNDGNTIFPNTAYQTIHLGTNSSVKYINDLILQQSGNADPDTFYTITEQEDRYWETFTQKDVTGGNSAWSWIHSEMSDANTPYVLIETKKLDSPTKTWLFTANGTLKMPGAINFQQNATISLGKPAANGANDRITLWDFEGAGSGYNYAIGAEGNHIWFAMDVDNGTGGFKFYSRDNLAFKIRDNGILESKILTYSVLPAATTAGLRAFISDADTAASGNFGAVVSGGGANTVPVFSDGSDWRIG